MSRKPLKHEKRVARDVLPIQINLIFIGSPCNCFVWDVWYIWLNIYSLISLFSMLLQFLLKSVSNNKLFLCLQTVDHWASCWKSPLVVSGSWQFLHNFQALVMLFNVSCTLRENFFHAVLSCSDPVYCYTLPTTCTCRVPKRRFPNNVTKKIETKPSSSS